MANKELKRELMSTILPKNNLNILSNRSDYLPLLLIQILSNIINAIFNSRTPHYALPLNLQVNIL